MVGREKFIVCISYDVIVQPKNKTTGGGMAQPRMGTAMTVKFEPEIHAALERIAAKRRMNKSQVVRMLLKAGLEMHQDLESVGIITALDFGTALYEKFKETGQKGGTRNPVTE